MVTNRNIFPCSLEHDYLELLQNTNVPFPVFESDRCLISNKDNKKKNNTQIV